MATIAGLTGNPSPPMTGGEMSQFDYNDHDGMLVSTMVVLTMFFLPSTVVAIVTDAGIIGYGEVMYLVGCQTQLFI